MDNTDLLKSQLEVDDTAATYLLETAKWAKFLAIVGFVFCGIFVLYGLFASFFVSYFFGTLFRGTAGAGMGGIIAAFMLIGAVFVFIPNYFLFKFSTKMKAAILSSDQLTLNESLNLHRRYYKFIGICMIVVLSFYALMFLLVIIGSFFR